MSKENVAIAYIHFGFVYVKYIYEKSTKNKDHFHILGKKKKNLHTVMKMGSNPNNNTLELDFLVA